MVAARRGEGVEAGRTEPVGAQIVDRHERDVSRPTHYPERHPDGTRARRSGCHARCARSVLAGSAVGQGRGALFRRRDGSLAGIGWELLARHFGATVDVDGLENEL
ncbi:hypothetical protein BRD02_08725 [Halobacteriales archaeon QS_8_69_73]|nr:MAG: hypothetical protein BRD02_08725 [Halobacteriales archaeon QS_8_69_73]